MASVKSAPSLMSLAPHELSITVQAFEAALARVDESASHISAYSARQNLAFVIIETALAWERDVIRLRDEGLHVLGISAESASV